jgi:hypothetical protein
MKYGDIFVDSSTESIYIYGLSGEKPAKNSGNKYEGYFIQKYDLQGVNKWKKQRDVSSKLSEESFFRINGKLLDRYISLTITPDDDARFQIFFKDQIHTFEYDANGEKKSFRSNEVNLKTKNIGGLNFARGISTSDGRNVDFGIVNLSIRSKEHPRVFEYFKSLDATEKKKNVYRYYESSVGEILIEDNPTAEEFKVLYFKK